MNVDNLIAQQKDNMNRDWKDSIVSGQENELQKYLWNLSLETGYSLIGDSMVWKTVLIVCAGNGYDANFWHQKWAIVTATDLSEEACKKIQERNPSISVQGENAENLSFQDNTFDYVIVRAWLHHLPRPTIWIYEMLRVAKIWILFMEAQDSLIMRILRKLWLVLEIEPSWNYVYTFTRREIEKLCKTMFLPDPKIQTFFFQHMPFLTQLYTKLDWRHWLVLYKWMLSVFNLLFWYWGNNFICYIKKQ